MRSEKRDVGVPKGWGGEEGYWSYGIDWGVAPETGRTANAAELLCKFAADVPCGELWFWNRWEIICP